MTKTAQEVNHTWYFFIILYLIVDFAHPQDVLPFLKIIRPGLLVILTLSIYVMINKAFWLNISHIRLIWCILGLLFLQLPFATNKRYAFDTLEGMLTFMPYILSTVACITNLKTLRNFININILLMIYISIQGILNGGKGTGGYFFDENDLSLYINTIFPFCYFYFFYQKVFLWRLIYFLAFFLGIVTNVVSFSRGGFVGMAIIAGAIWCFSKKKLLTLVILSVICLTSYNLVKESYLKEVRSISDTSESTASWRIMAWKSAIRMFLDNPLGVGGNNFQVRLPEYQPEDSPRGYYGRPAHSIWFTLIPELGIIGIFLYLSLLYHIFKDLLKITGKKPLFEDPDYSVYYATALGLICGCLGYLASGTFLSVFYYPHLWYFAALVAAMHRIQTLKLSSVATSGS